MSSLKGKLQGAISSLFPGYFAMVMATGVVAIQANKLGYVTPAKVLVLIAVLTYAVLCLLTITRSIYFGQNLVADFRAFVKGPAFFTTSAATTVLGKSLLLVMHQTLMAQTLWVFAWFIWVFLSYAFAINVFTSNQKMAIQDSVNGVWLIIPVATQSLSILTCLLSPTLPNHGLMVLVSLSLYMLGCALYLIVIAAVLYRLVFFPLEPQDLRPAYWVCMGAAAISTLAGVELCKRVDIWVLPFNPLPSLQGFTMFFWVVATAWIPLLIGLGVWRHAIRKVKITYDPQYWSMVFPLAMYAICTGGIVDIFKLTALGVISQGFLFIAGAAWLAVFSGLIRNLIGDLLQTIESKAGSTENPVVQGLGGSR